MGPDDGRGSGARASGGGEDPDAVARQLAERTVAAGAPGAVVAVGGRDEVAVAAAGVQDHAGATPMRTDAVLRITSMTKPIVAAAALRLVEAGRLHRDAPVDDLLPELADPVVLRRPDGPLDDVEAAHRPIIVEDLLTSRLGTGMTLGEAPLPVQRADALGLCLGPPEPASDLDPDAWAAAFGSVPLQHQPGTTWMYDTASAVLGVLVARAAGAPLGSALRDLVLGPLGMADTGFVLRAEQAGRLADMWEAEDDPATGRPQPRPTGRQWLDEPAFPCGAAGLLSTAVDVAAFVRMLAAGGVAADGVRLLAQATVDAMTTDRLTSAQRGAADPWLLDDGLGWGLGLAVTAGAHDPGAARRYGWDGGYGTSWRTDAASGRFAVVLTQRLGMMGTADAALDALGLARPPAAGR